MSSSKNCFYVFGLLLLLLIGTLFSDHAKAQGTGAFKINPSGISGSAGAGVALFDVKKPSTSFELDQGIYAAVQGERGLGFLHLYLTISLSFLTTQGQTAYKYSTLAGDIYTGSDVNFTTQVFQGGLGVKFKLLQAYWVRPYVEAGGTGGYYQITYSNIAGKVTGPGTAAKDKDAILDFGTYYEGGVELSFSPTFGIQAAARFTNNKTKPFVTLDKQRIEYTSEIYYLSVLKNF
ncbi:MAG: hypothetical protein ABIR96_07540 [Bdellovibrionota bacterium]